MFGPASTTDTRRKTTMRHARSTLAHLLTLTLAVGLTLALAGSAHAVATSRTNIDTQPSGASVYLIEGGVEKLIGQTPLKLYRLPRGLVQLKFKKDGYEDNTQSLTIAARVDTFNFALVRSIQPGTVELSGGAESSGATVQIDGKNVGQIPISTKVAPGRHQVVVSKDGYQSWERWLDVSEGQKSTYDVVLAKNEAPKGGILVTSNPTGGDVRVNGSPQGKTPAVVEGLAAGSYIVEVVLTDYQTFSQTVTVEPQKRAVIDAQLKKTKGDLGDLKVRVTGADDLVITVDGEEIGRGTSATKTGLQVGTHQVEARNPKGFYGVQTVEIRGGEVTNTIVTVAQTGTATIASVRVAGSRPGGTVAVDDGAPMNLPAQFTDLAPGTHVFTVKIAGFADWVKTVTLKGGDNDEIVAQVEQAGRIEVRAKDGKSQGQVFVDGKPIGATPFIGELPAGTHTVLVQRDDGAQETFDVAIAPDRVVKVAAAFGSDKPAMKRRPMPFSARALSASTGHASIALSYPEWPYFISARAGGGVGYGFDINVEARTAFATINELELMVKWNPIDTGTLAVALEGGIGGGIGANSRSSFVMDLAAVGSLMIGEKAAITLRLGTLIYSDSTGPGPDDSDSGVRLSIGLRGEFEVAKSINFFLHLEGDPVGGQRDLWDLGMLRNPSPKLYAGLGLSFMF